MTTSTIIKPDIKAMTVPDLKAFCIRKNIPIKGLKLRSQFEKAIESHTLAPIKITSAEADQLLQKPGSQKTLVGQTVRMSPQNEWGEYHARWNDAGKIISTLTPTVVQVSWSDGKLMLHELKELSLQPDESDYPPQSHNVMPNSDTELSEAIAPDAPSIESAIADASKAWEENLCPTCNGYGETDEATCPTCGGDGEAPSPVEQKQPPRERPILFSTQMVRAILDGKKTQTRRLMKPQPRRLSDDFWIWEGKDGGLVWETCKSSLGCDGLCLYGVQGDRLWVREKIYGEFEKKFPKNFPIGTPIEDVGNWWYATDDNLLDYPERTITIPCILMPRWASRITLEITETKIERLQNISEEDALAEGVQSREDFERLWDSLHPENDWQSNPWVWVVDFIKVDCSPQG